MAQVPMFAGMRGGEGEFMQGRGEVQSAVMVSAFLFNRTWVPNTLGQIQFIMAAE